MDKTQAILVGRRSISESSLLVTWLSRDLGLLRTRARGALRARSAMAGRLDLFVSAEIAITPPLRGETWTLCEVDWSQPRLGLRQDYLKVLAASYLVRLLQAVVEPMASVAELHDLLSKALDYLESHPPSLRMVQRFEWRVAQDLGLSVEGTEAPAQAIGQLMPHLHDALLVQRRDLLSRLVAP